MEQRLFLAACVMYAFSLASKYLFKKNKLENSFRFGLWHAVFLALFLGCLYGIFNFIISNSSGITPSVSITRKDLLAGLAILAISAGGFWYAKRPQAHRQAILKWDMDWANTIYFAGFVASIVMFFFVQAFKIPSASMYNTLQIGDHLFVNKAAYGFRIPLTNIRFGQFKQVQPGDIIIFSFPAENREQVNCGGYQYGRDYVKRVIAVPGDKVEIKNGDLYINDKKEPLHGYEVFRLTDRFSPVVTQEEGKEEDGLVYIAPAVYQTLWESRKLEHDLGMSLRDNFGPVTVPQGQYFAMGDNRDDSCDSRFWGPVPFENIKGTAWFIHWPLSRIRLIK